ncbi:gallate dioxygenase [Paraburkholderia acidisoli]|uniref:Gallate dioxygenase n=1 Tax=Paraburkholderia acidisoli TaxID=2571748 RepID=A0A7Z2GP21_9BURK|nr:gallate dioxygenase [Paraburkholderia acidisoli]QGZ65341.1 gallate dioxygenase [Paraburkholderia acidisoli]
MATLVGGIAVSHTPTIGFALDANKQDDPAWAPIFATFEPVKRWLREQRPDVIVYVYNDHVTSFFFDHYSAFALGIGGEYHVADEGGGVRDLPPVAGNPQFARHLGMSLCADEFDMAFFQDKPLDHGFFSPMSALLDHDETGWPTTVVPLQVGVLQFPIPTARRCYKLGQALRRAIDSYPDDLRVVVMATGGLSHQVHGERAGFNNVPWDHQFMEAITHDPEALAQMTHAELAAQGGLEGAEVIMWLIMRGALAGSVKPVHSGYYLPSMTGIGTLVLENTAKPLPGAANARQRAHIAQQLDGAGALEGTYPFDLAASVKAYRLNKYLHAMIGEAHRRAFLEDPEATFEAAGLSEEERDLVRRRDWRGLIHYGVIFFMLEKLGAVVGVSNLHIYAAMRGETLDDFLQTRNTKVLYSVTGKTAEAAAWSNAPAQP